MKRFALTILLVTAVAGGVFLALNRPSAEAGAAFTITVDTTFDNVYSDSFMTLPEAMKLATGDLTLDDLDLGECNQVSDTYWQTLPPPSHCESTGKYHPGVASADTIVFNTSRFPPGSPATITLTGSLPVLDTGDDTVDGSAAGVIVEGGGTDEFDCFEITSDSNTIKGLEIYNCDRAVYVHEGAQNNTIGGSTTPGQCSGDCNIISANDVGVKIWGDGTDNNTVKGNFIGTNATGDAADGNRIGVLIRYAPQYNTIGGTDPGEGNLIAFNDEDGVEVRDEAATGNTIRGNSIHSNGRRGIFNNFGGNTELPPPTITGFGSVMGTACADCIIDIYSDDEDEGRVYEGSTTADEAGEWSFSGTPGGPNITATATDSDGNTSEFSDAVAVPEVTPTPTTTPTGTPTGTPTATPTPEATRSLFWGPGWHSATWTGASTPEEAFACAAGNYAAAYRLVSGGWERYFPDRPDISNMTDLEQYDAFLILVTGDVTCEMTVADPAGTERTLDWAVGWQNDGWTGADGMPPEDVFDCAGESYAAAYRLVGGGWERHFPDRPDVSNMGPLDEYDAFLILVTAPVSCSMAIAP